MTIAWTVLGILVVCLIVASAALAYRTLTRRAPSAPTRRPRPTSLETRNKAKGTKGERAVHRRLLEELPSAEYELFLNVHVPRPNSDRTIEVDHVVVSRFGVYAIETKTWPGTLSQARDPEVWVQKMGRAVNEHANPVTQNRRQVRALTEYLGLRTDAVHGLVCMNAPDTTFATQTPSSVVPATRLSARIVKNQKAVLSDEGVALASQAIATLKRSTGRD